VFNVILLINLTFVFIRHGFDHYLGIPYSHGMCPCLKCFDIDARNGSSSCHNECRNWNVGCPVFSDETIIEQPTDFTLLTNKYTKAAVDFIQSSVHQHKKPFFLYMAYHQTHHPQFAGE
jgi:arylsulfatase A